MMAVPCWSSWKTGIFISALSRCSISKHSGAAMSSRLMPPNVGSRIFTALMNCSVSRVATSMSNTSMSAKRLKRTAFPSIAGKPVMEGKAVLFKRFADIDVFDIEVATRDTEQFINAVKILEPTFGGINLEDIAAPECFEIEQRLKAEMKIPVFHDDQHGTAIISAAALRNALEIANKKIDAIKIVVCGAGAAAMACLRLYIKMGLRKENAILTDSK